MDWLATDFCCWDWTIAVSNMQCYRFRCKKCLPMSFDSLLQNVADSYRFTLCSYASASSLLAGFLHRMFQVSDFHVYYYSEPGILHIVFVKSDYSSYRIDFSDFFLSFFGGVWNPRIFSLITLHFFAQVVWVGRIEFFFLYFRGLFVLTRDMSTLE